MLSFEELYGIEPPEQVALIYDDTVWGSAKDGVIITTRRIGFKMVAYAPSSIGYDSLTHDDVA